MDQFAPAVILKTDKSLQTLKRICYYKNIVALSVSANASKNDNITAEIREYSYGTQQKSKK